jgi:hypothetical protein
MKKILMTIAGALMIGLTAVNAQTDSTQRRKDQPQQVDPSMQQPNQGQSQYRTQDRITIPADQVPSSLRQTLQGTQYKGWETTPLYQDRITQEYYFELPDANGTTKRLHRFDRNGKPITGSGMDGAGNQGVNPGSVTPAPEGQTKPEGQAKPDGQ